MGRFGHVSVIETVDFVEGHVLVTVEAEHSYEVCVLLIAAEELQLPVSRNHKHRSSISTDMVQRSEVVNGRSQVTQPLLTSLRKMSDHLTAIWYQRLDLSIRIYAESCTSTAERSTVTMTKRWNTCNPQLRKATPMPSSSCTA